jgi:SAM-dependent methyltransferase
VEQSYIPRRTCPVCEGRSGTVLGQLTYALFDDLNIPGTKTLIRCDACGMMYDDVAFTEEQLQEYYRRNEHYAVSSTGGTGGLSADNLNRYDRIIDNLDLDPGGVILDIGCGQGGFVAQCLKRGFSAAGIEPSEKSRNTALSAGLDIYASVEEYAEDHPQANIRTVIISHVLEHLLNPSNMLQELASYAPDALVYIEVPDAVSYLSPNAIRWHELYFEHLNHFCMESLSNFAAKSGIDVSRTASTSFSRNQADVQCLIIVGQFGDLTNDQTMRPMAIKCPRFTLPPLPHGNLPQDNSPVALWGISQYAMLLMGSLSQLIRVDRLFDASPAKIGRKIRGITIEDAKEIGSLAKETALIIPYSQYSQQMRIELDGAASFSGVIVNI